MCAPRGGGKRLFAFAHLNATVSIVFCVAAIWTIVLTLYAIWGFRLTRTGRRFIREVSNSWPPEAGDIKHGITLGIGLMIASIVLEALFPGGEKNATSYAKTDIDHFFLLIAYIVASISEEIQFRGYFLQQLAVYTRSTGSAIVLQAVFFVFMHGLDQSVSGYLTRFAIGIVFGIAAINRKSLWPSITAHLLINITVFIVALY